MCPLCCAVFIPGGWWHAVLNLDDTIGITQNFCSKTNFRVVWRETRTGRKKMAVKWLKRLREVHPELAVEAERLNAEDGFVMPERKPACAEGEEEKERPSKHKKSKKSSMMSRSRSSSRGSSKERDRAQGELEKNMDGRKKHLSALDAWQAAEEEKAACSMHSASSDVDKNSSPPNGRAMFDD